jgi:hypothetical protein
VFTDWSRNDLFVLPLTAWILKAARISAGPAHALVLTTQPGAAIGQFARRSLPRTECQQLYWRLRLLRTIYKVLTWQLAHPRISALNRLQRHRLIAEAGVMPILYVHGVATRDSLGFDAMKPYLARYIAPAISTDPDHVATEEVFWGGSAATFRWDGASRPKTRLLGQGPMVTPALAGPALLTALLERELLSRVPETVAMASGGGGLLSGRSTVGPSTHARLSALSTDELSDLLTELIHGAIGDTGAASALCVAADAIARDPTVRSQLATQPTAIDEADYLLKAIERQSAGSSLIGQGTGLGAKLRDRLSEAVKRGGSAPAYAASLVAAEIRPWLNELASLFIGDVLEYLNKRGDAQQPGPIPQLVLDALDKAHRDKLTKHGEPLVVITHSMGGQLIYDAVTHFIPNAAQYKGIKIDFWCATASQVGFFEELKLFKLRSDAVKAPKLMPFPHAHLGVWWNVWDTNDFLSYTAQSIFDGVQDESYDSGLSLVTSHSGYLRRPSFYRKLSAKLEQAAKSNWRTT